MSLWLKKSLVSSANRIGSNKLDAFCRSLSYTRNRSGPRKDPWGTPQVTYLGSVLLFSPISMYCFLLDNFENLQDFYQLCHKFSIFSVRLNDQLYQMHLANQ